MNENNLLKDKIYKYFNYKELYDEAFNPSINQLEKYLVNSNNDINYFKREISTEIKINKNDNPYNLYMKRVNAVHKIYQLKIFNKVIKISNNIAYIDSKDFISDNYFNESFFNELKNFYLVLNYINNWLFNRSNFPEYPEGENNYINKDEFFLMGDNRYNSHDCRFNSITNNVHDDKILLDKDDISDFSKQIYASWAPSTIKIKHILGKAVAIYFPLNRMKIF